MLTTLCLPKPDQFGNLWFDTGKERCRGAAILHSSLHRDKFLGIGGADATAEQDRRILFDGAFLRYFETAEEAFEALREAGIVG